MTVGIYMYLHYGHENLIDRGAAKERCAAAEVREKKKEDLQHHCKRDINELRNKYETIKIMST